MVNSSVQTAGQSKRRSYSLSQRVSLWISERARRAAQFTLTQKNIYIFPSASGFGFAALLLLMLVTAINYQSSLVYMLTFLLGAIFFVSIWLCFLNLRGLQVESADSQGVFAGNAAFFRVRLLHAQQHVYGLQLAVRANGCVKASLEPGKVALVDVPVDLNKRGRYRSDRLLIETYYPFGLIRGWTWLKLDADCLIYPAPIAPPEDAYMGGEGASAASQQKGGDRDVLRGFQAGDTLARVHWKKFASGDQLVVRDQGFVMPERLWLKWEDFPEADAELRLSYLCDLVLSRQAAGEDFGLELPGRRISPHHGRKHASECLAALAEYGKPVSDPAVVSFELE
ncbi:MAG: hypothetical protein C9356_16780 [Oleiphilus sp.]|nr:MAG: hypothetical protein C9356_16780 [Oleiphilus sp.]